METQILLARHGETEWNRGETEPAASVRFRGRADLPLSERGRRQVAALAERIAAEFKPAAIHTSPLLRARETAEAIAKKTGAPLRPAPGLVDVEYSAWQGLTAAEAQTRDPEAFRAWIAGGEGAQVPGGERLIDVSDRAWRELTGIAASHPGACAVAVSHDVVCALLIAQALGLPLTDYQRLRQRTTALSLLIHDAAGWTVGFRDDVRHLGRAGGPHRLGARARRIARRGQSSC